MNRIGLIILYELKLILRNWLFILYVIIYFLCKKFPLENNNKENK